METSNPLIVIVDDDITEEHPLIGHLCVHYKKDDIHIFQSSTDGIRFIEENLSKKIIVLLDIMFDGKEVGVDIFNEVLKKSALVCFIVVTGNIEKISNDGLKSLINGHAWYIIQRDRPAKEILDVIREAEKHLKLRVDGAIEEWIMRYPQEDRVKPFIKTRSGKSYSLLDILSSIRTGDNDEIGQKLAGDILSLAIDLLMRDKTNVSGGE